MAVATDITGLSDDEIVERLRQRTEEYNKLKADREAAKTADPETGKAKKPWYMPKERPPISAFLMPLMLLYSIQDTKNPILYYYSVLLVMAAGWFGHIAVEWFEDTEWRKRLRADAQAASKAREDAEAKAKKKDEKPEPKTDGSTKKRVAKKTD